MPEPVNTRTTPNGIRLAHFEKYFDKIAPWLFISTAALALIRGNIEECLLWIITARVLL